MQKVVALLCALAVAAVITMVAPVQAGPPPHAACRPENAAIPAKDLPAKIEPGTCDFQGRPIRDVAISAVVPPPGVTTHAEALFEEGSDELVITHLEDDTVLLSEVGEGAGSQSGGTGPVDCSDEAFNDQDVIMDAQESWSVDWSSKPSYLTQAETEDALRRGGTNVTQANNNCGRADYISASLTYNSQNATWGPDISAQAECGAGGYDGNSVVGFGDLPPHPDGGYMLAVECTNDTWEVGYNSIIESDIRINDTDVSWTTTGNSPSCSGKWDLQAVMTHERGHTFGLGHVSENGHEWLTMSPYLEGKCQISERSLGLGDLYGFENKY